MGSSDWKTILDEEPDNELVRFTYAKALMDESQWAAAIQQFETLLRQQPDYVIAWAHLARCALNAGDRARARQACDEGYPHARRLNHEAPLAELDAVMQELDSEF